MSKESLSLREKKSQKSLKKSQKSQKSDKKSQKSKKKSQKFQKSQKKSQKSQKHQKKSQKISKKYHLSFFSTYLPLRYPEILTGYIHIHTAIHCL